MPLVVQQVTIVRKNMRSMSSLNTRITALLRAKCVLRGRKLVSFGGRISRLDTLSSISRFSLASRFEIFLVLLLLSPALAPIVVSPVRGNMTGLICLAPPQSTTCPPQPVNFTGTLGSQLKIAVLVQGSDGFAGFDITLKSDHTILKPADANVAGSLLDGGILIDKCIGGVLVNGPVCLPTDTVDTIHIAYLGPGFGDLTWAPTTGLLFTAVFNITSVSSTTISYQTGCFPSAVVSSSTCVLLPRGSVGFPSEIVQSANYVAPTPDFMISVSPSSVNIMAGGSSRVAVTIISVNGFSATVIFSATTPSGITATFNPTSVVTVSGGTTTSTLSLRADPNCNVSGYLVTVNGASGSLSHSTTVRFSLSC